MNTFQMEDVTNNIINGNWGDAKQQLKVINKKELLSLLLYMHYNINPDFKSNIKDLKIALGDEEIGGLE